MWRRSWSKTQVRQRNLNRNLKPFLPLLGSNPTIMKKDKSSWENGIYFLDRITDLKITKYGMDCNKLFGIFERHFWYLITITCSIFNKFKIVLAWKCSERKPMCILMTDWDSCQNYWVILLGQLKWCRLYLIFSHIFIFQLVN